MKLKPTYIELEKELEALKATNSLIEKSSIVKLVWKNEKNWPIKYVSKNASIIFGYTVDDLLSEKFIYSKMIYPEDLELVLQEIMEGSKDGITSFEHKPYRIISKSGEIKWVNNITLIRRNKNNEITHYEGIIIDITKKIKDEEVLKESELKYKILAENAAFGIVIHNKNEILYVNNKSAEILNYDNTEELFNKSAIDFVIPDFKERTSLAINKAMTEDISVNLEDISISLEEIFIKKDGSYVDVEVFASLITFNNQKAIQLAFSDISERKQFEKDLKKAKEKAEESDKTYKGLFNSVSEAIYIQNNDGVFIDVNYGTYKMYGYTREELLGKTPEMLSAPNRNNMSHVLSLIKSVFETGNPERFEFWGLRKNGEIFPKEVIVSKLKYFGKDVVITTARDITKRKQAELEIIKAKEEAEEINERFNLAIEATSDGLWDWDLITNEIYYSPRWKSILGYEDHELQNDFSVWEKLTTDDDVKKLFEMLNKHIAGDLDKLDMEFKMQHKNGHWIDISSRATAFYNDQGKAYRVVGTHTDITESLKAKLLLQKSEDRFRKLIDNMPSGVAIYKAVNDGEDFEFIDINKKSLEITNSTKKELLGHTLLEKFPTMKNGPFINSLKKIAKDGVNVFLSPFFYEDAQRQGWRENHIYKLASGEIVAIFKDITDVKEAEEQLKRQNIELLQAKEKAEESNRLKTEFINNMSHEIRTPLNGILGFSKFLDSDNLSSEKRKNYISIINNSGHQLMHIIDDIIEISRLGTKQVKIIEEEICLNDLLLENFSIFDIKAKENRTPLYFKRSLSDQESLILTDGTKLNKILGNLLENALKFTHQGFVELGYNLKVTSKSSEIEIYVKDTGIGIKPESQEMIFERFSQEEKSLSRNVGGLGLGLSIAKENAELLGGKISLISEKDKGSTFFITIPYKPVNKKLSKNNLDIKVVNLSETQKLYTILIAEDEEINYLFLETLLKLLDLKLVILHAKHGKEALEICQENAEIDLVLMDLKMPIMSGFEATKLIKEFRPHLPIIAQTAYSTQEEKKLAYSAGCNGFISKPINREELCKVMNEYIR